MIPYIFDAVDTDGIDFVFDLENGMSICVYMDDEEAKNLIAIIQNKLNARFKLP